MSQKFDESPLHLFPVSQVLWRELVYVGNGALQQRKRRFQPRHSNLGSAKNSSCLRNGADADQQPCPNHPETARSVETKRITYFVESAEWRALSDVTGEPVDFAKKIYVGLTSIDILENIEEMLAEGSVQPSQFKGKIIFMSMCKRHQLVAKQEQSSMLSKRNTCCFVRQTLRTLTMLISRACKTKKSGSEA